MSDQPSPIESEDQIERRIDEVISQAAELAKDLKEELGDPEPAGQERDQKFFETQAASESAPEMQLAQADAAIAHAAREIGSAPPPPKATKISLPPRNAKTGGATPAATPQPEAKADPPPASPPAEPEKAPADAAATAAAESESTSADDLPESESSAVVTDSRSSQQASSMLERIVRMIEAIDRPFASVNADVRWVLGWVALVFLVGAASLFFFVIL